jgi:protein gp37
MARWDPWRGCRRVSEGCCYCYIHKGDAKRGVDTGSIVKTGVFDAPVQRLKSGAYKMKPGQTVYLCFSTDFLIGDADPWRGECWRMIAERKDLHFLFLTKRIGRFMDCIPADWGEGYDHVTVGCTVENQARADERLPVFQTLPIKHKNIILQPMLEKINITPYLTPDIELVVVGGESDRDARELDFDWVLDVRRQCAERGVHFQFRQCGTHFLKDGRLYTLQVRELASQARKADIDL